MAKKRSKPRPSLAWLEKAATEWYRCLADAKHVNDVIACLERLLAENDFDRIQPGFNRLLHGDIRVLKLFLKDSEDVYALIERGILVMDDDETAATFMRLEEALHANLKDHSLEMWADAISTGDFALLVDIICFPEDVDGAGR